MHTLLETGLSNAFMATVLAGLAFVASRFTRRPALAHVLWLLVLVKLVTPPLVPIHLPWPDSIINAADEKVERSSPKPECDFAAPSADRALVRPLAVELALQDRLQDEGGDSSPDTPAQRATPGSIDWREALLSIWLGGAALWFGRTGWSVLRFRRLLRSAKPASAAQQSEVRALAARLELTRAPQLWFVPGAISPMIWALGGPPRLIFPTRLLSRLDANQRAALLLHELAHVRRGDHWVRLVELVVQGLYWWHPVVWLARRELREAEEQCCDAWVVWASAGAGRAYALALLEAVAFVSRARLPLPVGASGIGPVSHLRRRLTMIMQGTTPRSLSAAGWLAVLALGLFLLPLAPAQAQEAPKEKRTKDDIKKLTDQKIEELKRTLNDLEAQRVQEIEFANVFKAEQESQELEKLQAEAAKLKKMVEIKRQELQELEIQLKKVVMGLERAKSGKSGEVIKDNAFELRRREFQKANEKQRAERDRLKKEMAEIKAKELKSKEDTKAAVDKELKAKLLNEAKEKAAWARKAETQSKNVEERLERLLKEVELLRQEIRKTKPDKNYQ
jgi:beta-lactamase regulating signal transducer with metallopeptidase domain